MARIFNKEVLSMGMVGTAEVFTPAELNELFGRADTVVVQTKVGSSGGTSPTITVKYYRSNDNQEWDALVTLENGVPITSLPYDNVEDTSGNENGAYGRIGVTLGGTNPTALVKLIVSGRTS